MYVLPFIFLFLLQCIVAIPVPRLITRMHTAPAVTSTSTYITGTTTVWLPPIEIFISDGVTYTYTLTDGQWATTQVINTSTYVTPTDAGPSEATPTNQANQAGQDQGQNQCQNQGQNQDQNQDQNQGQNQDQNQNQDQQKVVAESTPSPAAPTVPVAPTPSTSAPTTDAPAPTTDAPAPTTDAPAPTTPAENTTPVENTTEQPNKETETTETETNDNVSTPETETPETTTSEITTPETTTSVTTPETTTSVTTPETTTSVTTPETTTSVTTPETTTSVTTPETTTSVTTPETTTSVTTPETTQTSSPGLIAAPGTIVYSPYANDRSCKTYEAIQTDLQLIKSKGISKIRLYSTDCLSLTAVLPLCKQMGITVNQGFWISGAGVDSIDASVSDLVNWANTNGWDLFDFITIGNEAVNSGFCSVSDLISKISSVKNTLKSAGYSGPVTTAEPPVTFINSPELCTDSEIDFVAVQPHSYFNANLYANQAGDYVVSQRDEVARVCSKSAYISETGYPHKGDTYGNNVPSEANQLAALKSIMDQTGGDVTILTTYDDMWKDPGPHNIEQYFGMITIVQ